MNPENPGAVPPQQQPQPAQPFGYYPYPPQEDEISLQDLAVAVWKTRMAWVVSMVVVSMLFWGVLIGRALLTPSIEQFSLPLYLTFENVEKGQYPNGSSFARSDLVASTVLQEVYRSHQLEQFELRLEEFQQAISVAPYAPDEEMIRLKYERIIADNE